MKTLDPRMKISEEYGVTNIQGMMWMWGGQARAEPKVEEGREIDKFDQETLPKAEERKS
jgi:hypothetical protein